MGSRLVFDIEADGFLYDVTTIHCIATYDIDTGVEMLYHGDTLEEGVEALSRADLLVGHHILGYDLPALRKIYPDYSIDADVVDTLTLGCLLYPDDRILSLELWAIKLRLKQQKVQHEDWTKYTPAMGVRCQSDVRINYSVYQYLLSHREYELVSDDALQTEQRVALIHAIQAHYGVSFDVASAVLLIQELDARIEERREQIIHLAPWSCQLFNVPKIRQDEQKEARKADVAANKIPDGTCTPFKKDGTYNVATLKYFEENVHKVQGPYTKVDIRPINPDSDDEVKNLLLSLGWVPTEWNFKKNPDGSFYTDASGQRQVTSPRLTEDSYDSLPDGLGKLVAEYNMMNHRRNYLLNRKDSTKGAVASVRDDGKVSADAFTCGTNTGRYRHSGTVCNIPRPSSPYGQEIRSLFCVRPPHQQVGVDLSGIEARCLAHYLIQGGYTDAEKTAALILSPDKTNDFHSYNAKQWGVSRDIAKNTLYALMYGAGAVKLAQTAGKPEKEGARIKADFYAAHPGIKELIDDLESTFKQRNYIKGLDGRPLYIRSKTKLLNTLLQGAAAVIFKKWMIALAAERGPESVFHGVIHQIIAYHDELQFECEQYAEEWGKMCESVAARVGKELGIKVPIEAVAKIGKNWAECH